MKLNKFREFAQLIVTQIEESYTIGGRSSLCFSREEKVLSISKNANVLTFIV